jgi:hypothetical protein
LPGELAVETSLLLEVRRSAGGFLVCAERDVALAPPLEEMGPDRVEATIGDDAGIHFKFGRESSSLWSLINPPVAGKARAEALKTVETGHRAMSFSGPRRLST